MTTAKTTAAKKPRATTARTKNSLMAAGSGIYECRCCHRQTRATGNGDNEHVTLCEQCYSLAGNENHMNDNGGALYDRPEDILYWIQVIEDKRGDVSGWADVKAAALAAMLPPGSFEATDAHGKAHPKTTAGHAVALVKASGSGRVVEYHGATACLVWALQAGQWWLLGKGGERLHQQVPS